MKEEKEFHQNYWQRKTRKQVKYSEGFLIIAIFAIVVILAIIGIVGNL